MSFSINEISVARRKRFALVSALILMVFSVPLLFENCSQPPNASTNASSVAQSAPFAFNTAVDQLAYMSCSGAVGTPAGLFSFGVGAFGPNSGVQITQAFYYAARNLLTVKEKIAALQQSPLNGGAYAQLGIRSPSTPVGFQTVWSASNPLYVSQFVGDLTQTSVATDLFSGTGTAWHQSLSVNGVSAPMTGLIQVMDSEANTETVRQLINSASGAGYLTLAYSRVGSTPQTAISPGAAGSSIFGLGYKMTFALGFGQAPVPAAATGKVGFSSGAAHVLTSISEYDLTTQKPSGHSWSCDPNLVMLIVNSAADIGPNIRCTPNVPATTDPNYAIYLKLRTFLPAANWDIDVADHCVIPIGGTAACNGGVSPTTNYTGGVCIQNTQANGQASNTCPHYISICQRN